MKEKITEASISLFEQKGFSTTTIQDIADSIGATKGTFYYYFKSKEQLLKEIHLEYIIDLLKRQEAIVNDSTSNKEKLHAVIEMLIGDIRKNGPRGRVFFREIRHLAEENIRIIKKERDRYRLNIESIIRSGIAAGEFKPNLRSDMVAFAVLGMANYSYNWFQPDGEVEPSELAAIYTSLVLGGIVKENGTPENH
ncbi:transcriptional regulator, TetR family [Bhargavaea beijingensis]|uniref:Transcriptional regulator, TetR family n=1 Tax=Bhargavaea beijingensis TaxID=426756 RepID=A0A1G7EJQ8_9BACL|nr:TetR/AcrR family transcriptional regulator [Bhargavaea beijingensis]SDE63817.1 transcriptional regulator, TetR family [Bhargavaea beijingensis]